MSQVRSGPALKVAEMGPTERHLQGAILPSPNLFCLLLDMVPDAVSPPEGPEAMPRLWGQTLALPLISRTFLDPSFTPSGLRFWACRMEMSHKAVKSQ